MRTRGEVRDFLRIGCVTARKDGVRLVNAVWGLWG